jgi:acyl carrier protein
MSEAKASQEEVLETIAGFIREVIGQEWAVDVAITMDTSFNRDLELESIEFVALAEKVQRHYQGRVEFAEWLSKMELDQIISLRVGDVVEFIVRCP